MNVNCISSADYYHYEMVTNGKRVLVGLSGGVDSAVATYILQQQGFDVTAGFMINYTTEDETCTTKEDLQEAQKVADFLGIKLHIFDYQEEYHNRIIRYIIESYEKGLTPNPDILCNSEVKFKLFLEEGIALGFDYIATGHYAQIHQENNGHALYKGVDPQKDQSYFLAGLNQFQLSKALFPLGNMLKSQVRQIAKDVGLPNANRKDSQGICFIGKIPMKDFLKQYLPEKKGDIIDTHGKKLGEHTGIWGYTIGQRQGLGVSAPESLFVIKKELETNTLIVGYADSAELYTTEIHVTDRHRTQNSHTLPRSGHAKIRYRQADQEVILHNPTSQNTFIAIFKQPQRAVASGQVLVAYEGEKVIGSGIII